MKKKHEQGTGGLAGSGELVCDAGGSVACDNPELVADGWVRRHLVDLARARETAELYRQIGFEVQVRDLNPADLEPGCEQCASGPCAVIYTRRPEDPDKVSTRDDAGSPD